MKNSRGITLIALIITIVVLLILAGVAIGTLQESNIIGHAKDAASSFEEAKGEEENEITDMEALLDKYSSKSNVTYADFWKAAYEKIGNLGEMVYISNHIYMGFYKTEEEAFGMLGYGYFSEDGEEFEMRYYMNMNNIYPEVNDVKANQWYSATSGSDIDFSSVLPLPEEISTNKSGTPFSGYEDLCALFDQAVGTEGCAPYVVNAN